ncbi:MAG: ABC transporter ATP-binding protein [Desulfovibrio sp.]|nr:ABC transporter ATP-binding protein [Desulfovibrio sp.]
MIRASGVGKSFQFTSGQHIAVLGAVDLHVRPGEFVAVVGPSGCGKTTLLKILAGLADPDAGSVRIGGARPKAFMEQGRIGYMSQADSLLPWRNVTGNVEIGLELNGHCSRDREEVVQDLIHRIGLEGFEKSYPFELSGGMKKRVALMRTLAYDPSIIYMDEPFGALDVQTRDMLEDDVLHIWDETQKTIVLVTHDLAEAICLADRVLLMTARPSAIKNEYVIDLPRPRNTEIRLTERFASILREIWKDLSAEVQKWPAPARQQQRSRRETG